MITFEFLDGRGGGVLSEWKLDAEPRKKLKRRIRWLKKFDLSLAKGSVIFNTKAPEVWEFEVKGKVQLRPMLCLGPKDNESEVTFLAAAIKRNNIFDPRNVHAIAVQNREVLVLDVDGRRKEYE